MNVNDIKANIRKRHKLGDSADVRILASCLEVKAASEGDEYKFVSTVTTDSLDRQDEVVIPQGGDLSEFLNSGIVAWNHNYDIPVAFPDKSKKVTRGENSIEIPAVFMKRPADYQGEFFPDFARAFVNQAMKAGVKPGVSIGFLPLESRRPSAKDKERWGERVQVVHSKWKLLEFSIAPVQANQDAYVTAISKGLITRDVCKAVGVEVPDETPVEQPKPQVIESAVVMLPMPRKRIDIGAMVRAEFKRQLLRTAGKIYAD